MTHEEDVPLLACPYCGTQPTKFHRKLTPEEYAIGCSHPGCKINPWTRFLRDGEPERIWNTRITKKNLEDMS